ncbi:MAG: LamG domain-containing protein, partial [Phycisphaeraceae bacterium]
MLIAVAMCTVMALSFLASQAPAAVVASNIDRKAKARAIAESALQMGIDYVNEHGDWRDTKSSGTWMSDASLDGGAFDLIGSDDDGDLADDPSDELTLTAVGRYDGVTHRVMARITPPRVPFAMEAGTIEVDGNATRVTLQGSYVRPVVVCTPQIANNSEPVVVRVDAVTGGSFDVWLQRCDGAASVEADTVHYMVVEEGVHNVDGVRCEARRFESTRTDRKNDWHGQARSYGQSYSDPVVFGQVMTARDPDWSAFWSRGSSQSNPPSSSHLFVGKHVGEDPDRDRVDETIGYIVFESGRHAINGVELDVRLSSDNVSGVTNGSGSNANYHQSFATTPQVVVATQAAMDGSDGAWALLWGGSSVTTSRARVIVDEDTLGDVERSHTTEQVGVIAFERPPDASSEQLILQYEFDQAEITPRAVAHWRLDEPAGGGGGVAAYDRVQLSSYGKIDSYDSSLGAYGPSNNAESASVSSNATGNDRIKLESHSRVEGNAYIGPGGDPESGIDVYSFSFLTGQKLEALAPATMPDLNPPSDLPASIGNVTYSSGTTVIDADRHFDDLTLSGDATLRIQGEVRIHVNNDFRMSNNSRIVLDSGARLTMWLDDSVELRNNAQLNADSTATDRLTVYVYGNNKRLRLREDAVMAGSVYVEGDFRLERDSVFYGRVLAGDDVEITNNAVLHADIALPTLGIATTPAVDRVIGNDGDYRGDAVGGGSGPAALAPTTAAVFDGVGDSVFIPHDDGYLLNDGTVCLWFNADTLGGEQGLLYKDASGFGEGGHLAIYLSGSSLIARLSSRTQQHLVSTSAITAGQWHHAALAFGAEGLVLYLDGVEADRLGYGGGLNTTSGGLGNREPIVLGADASNATAGSASPLTNRFTGRLDDVRLYDQWCSASQVGEVMSGGEPTMRLSPTLVRDTG